MYTDSIRCEGAQRNPTIIKHDTLHNSRCRSISHREIRQWIDSVWIKWIDRATEGEWRCKFSMAGNPKGVEKFGQELGNTKMIMPIGLQGNRITQIFIVHVVTTQHFTLDAVVVVVVVVVMATLA